MREFLDFIQPSGLDFVEIRAIRDGRVRQWWDRDRVTASDRALAQSDEGWDAYYGVLPRRERHGSSDAIHDTTAVLWADLDAKIHGSKQQSLMRLVFFIAYDLALCVCHLEIGGETRDQHR